MKSRPGKAAITVPNENRYVVKRPRRKFSSGWTLKAQHPAPRSQRERLFIRVAIRNNVVGVCRYGDESIDRVVLKQQCEIPYAIFGIFARTNGRPISLYYSSSSVHEIIDISRISKVSCRSTCHPSIFIFLFYIYKGNKIYNRMYRFIIVLYRDQFIVISIEQ